MNKSIRSKLFISIGLLLIFFTCLLWILNNLYLGQYYMEKKKNKLIESAKIINSIYKGNVENIRLELDRASNMTGGNIQIRNSEGEVLFSSGRKFLNLRDDINGHPRRDPGVNYLNKYKEGIYTFETQSDRDLKIDFLALVTGLSNGDNLSIRVPLLSIRESVSIANNFIIFTGILTLLLGSIWAFIFSRRFTRPIRELNSVTRDIAKFNFDKKCEVVGEDEIGQLGQSINYLSSELNIAMTDLNVKNKKLEEDIDKERKIDEMRKEFISSVSHELRTPISIIQGYAEGLISNVAEGIEDRTFYCNVIMKEADKMNKLVKDLLDISQIESGYFKLEKTEFDLLSLVQYLINKYRTVFTEKGIQVEFEKNENIFVYCDMIRTEQILTNLISNAINHVDTNKIIKIDIKTINEKIRVSLYNSGNHIPKDSLELIWTSFYKVDKARTRAYGGYGLGLSIVKVIQELHGNSYGVENVKGGVTFWFDIDRSENR